MWKEVFKAGLHVDANGNEREWTIEDLDTIVDKYNNQPLDARHEAPVVIGHPVDNSPAYAWVEELKREGDVLLAKFKQIDPQFEEILREGRYKKVSIALYPDLMLRHVGFLGAIPPAVKGLKDIKFNSSIDFIYFEELQEDANTINKEQQSNTVRTKVQQCCNNASTLLQQYSNNTPTLLRQCCNKVEQNKLNKNKYKYSFPPKFYNFRGQENYFTPNEKIIIFQGGFMDENNLNLFVQELVDWIGQTFNEEVANQTRAKIDELLPKYLTNTETTGTSPPTSTEAIEARTSQLSEFQELRRKLEKLERDNREMRFNEYFNSQLGRLVPSQKQIVRLAFEAVRNNNEGYQFSENGKIVSLNGEEIIKKLIESFPVQIEFNEFARKELYGERDSLDEQNKFIDEYYKNN